MHYAVLEFTGFTAERSAYSQLDPFDEIYTYVDSTLTHVSVYSPDELLSLRRYDVTPPRAVRKTIFSYGCGSLSGPDRLQGVESSLFADDSCIFKSG